MLSSLLVQMSWCQLIELWSHHNVSATLALAPNLFLYNFCLGPLPVCRRVKTSWLSWSTSKSFANYYLPWWSPTWSHGDSFPAAANSPMIGCMASLKALHLWFVSLGFCSQWPDCVPHTQSKKQKPKCCFHIRHLEHAAKKDCSKCSFSVFVSSSKLWTQHIAFQLLSASQSFATNILLWKNKISGVWLWIFTAKSIFAHTRMSFCMYQKHTKTN